MALNDNDDFHKKNLLANYQNMTDDDDDDKSGGESGGSQITFRDFSAENLRDDLLPPEEMRRLLSVHKDVHTANVKKQKELRAYRQQVREGKISVQQYRQGLNGGGGSSRYKPNPRLLNKAQFSGIDNKINPLPNQNAAETNEDKKELVLRNELRNELKNQPTPQFNPKPYFNR